MAYCKNIITARIINALDILLSRIEVGEMIIVVCLSICLSVFEELFLHDPVTRKKKKEKEIARALAPPVLNTLLIEKERREKE